MRGTLAPKLLTLSAVLLMLFVLPVMQARAGSKVTFCRGVSEGGCTQATPTPDRLTTTSAQIDSNRDKDDRFKRRLAFAGVMSGDEGGGPGSGRLSGKGLRGGESERRITWSVFLSLSVLLAAIAGVGLSLRSMIRRASPRRARTRTRFAYGGALACAVVAASLGGAFLVASSVGHAGAAARAPGRRAAFNPAQATDATFTSAFHFGGTGTVQIGGRAVDQSGNIYVTGGFNGTIELQTAPSPTSLQGTNDYDFFIAKFDPSGNPLWARMANGATSLPAGLSLDGGLAVAADQQGNAYVGGGFVSQLDFKDASKSTVQTLGDTNSDINFEPFVAKYDADGNLLWAKGGQSGAPDDPEAHEDLDAGINGVTDIVLDKSGNLFVGGAFAGTSFLGKAVTTAGSNDALVARLNPSTGTPSWVTTVGSADHDNVLGLGVDGNSNVYVVGNMEGDITFPTQPTPTTMHVDEGDSDTFLAKYNSGGQVLWAKEIGGTQFIEATHVAVDGAGQIYLTGLFQGTSQFDSITVTDDADTVNGFLAKYTTGGSALWVRDFGKSADGGATGERVTLDGGGNPYVIGLFGGSATFAEETSSPRTLESLGDEDQFVMKYDAAGNFKFVKQLAGSGSESENLMRSDDVPVDITLAGIVFNNAAGALQLTGDFQGTLSLDSLSLNSGPDRHGYVATLTPQQEAAAATQVHFSSSAYQIGEGGGQIQVTVLRTGDLSGTTTVDYATSDGTASQKSDYEAALGTLTFSPGDTSKTFRVLVVDDAFVEGDETVNLTLGNATGASVDTPSAAALTITDNDTTPTTTNPIDSSGFFVRQHYLDFLGRQPDASGLAFWVNEIESCGADANCREVKRVNVSAAFFLSTEFQETGFYAIRVQRVAFGRRSRDGVSRISYQQFLRDSRQVGDGVVIGQPGDLQQLEQNKQAYALKVVSSAEFQARFPQTTAGDYVDALYASAGVTPTAQEKQDAVSAFGTGDTAGRTAALRKVADSTSVRQAELNPAFVLMEYFGYLRRDPDEAGYQFWLDKLTQFNGDFIRAEMVKAFISSDEYRKRFGP